MRVRQGFLWGMAAGAVAAAIQLRRELYSFSGRSVVITGGSRGLGLLLARALGREGARLALLARDRDELARAAADLQRRGSLALTIPCDVRLESSVQSAIEQ